MRQCVRCHRYWSVSVVNKKKYYICPDCAERERKWLEKKGREDALRLGEKIADVRKVSGKEGFWNG